MKLKFQENTRFKTTSFLQELIGILVRINVSYNNSNKVIAYTDCKYAIAKLRDVIAPASNSVIHLPYGPILGSINHERLQKYQIIWVESHPERKKRAMVWDSNDLGIYKADMLASRTLYEIRRELLQMKCIENQVNTSTTCTSTELIYIRKIYQKEIESIVVAFNHLKLPKKEKWIKNIMKIKIDAKEICNADTKLRQ